MATYPGGIPSFTVPVSGDKLNNPNHITQHVTEDQEIVAIATELGINPKGVAASVAARLTTIEGSIPTVPVKATGAEADTGTDDAKFLTAKAAKDSHNIPLVAPGTSGNVLTSNGTDWTSAAPSGGASAVELSFVNADLSTGVLTVTHNKGLSAGYTALVTVVNNSGAMVIPDQINTFAANSFKVDLTSFGTLTGTWYVTYIVKG